MNPVIVFALASSLLALLYGIVAATRLLKQNAGSERMKEISGAIAQGAKAYLNRQYKTVALVALILAVILYFAFNATTAIGFLIGAVLSALAGYIGVNVSVSADATVSHV